MTEPATPERTSGEPDADEELLGALGEEFLARHRRGERPALEEYMQKHPSLADEIRDLFPAMLALEQSGPASKGNPVLAGEQVGAVIGRYKLLERIGEGGFGVVFMAEQTHPIRRKVALKVIKPGVDTKQVIARFEAERQALALMDHENIAKVFEAGATESGRPFFVMELVQGVPITDYCDRNNAPPRKRLQLFIEVCRAVQHAHTKGIIHRDIKPTNVLVTLHDGVPVPKVIDFGIAKATGQELTEKTLFTHFAQMVGTPLYMSPEQAEMSGLDADTRSDIYSLGVLLYELLTGTTPVDHARLKRAAFDEVRRIIREEVPPRPSTRLSTMSQQARGVSAQRISELKKLGLLVRGELDWIVMKCLEKDRTRRYETANLVAMDLQRYLSGEAVLAAPPSARYRFGKFARRNKGTLVTASLVLAALFAGTAIATWQAVVATRAKQRAVAAASAEKAAKETAQAREAETRAVLDFVQNKIFAAARPEGQDGGLGREVTLRRAIEAALPFVETSFTNEPLIEARMRMTLGTSFSYLGEPGIASDQREKARALYSQHRGPEHPDTLRSMNNLANSYYALGRHADALKLHEETLALMKAKLGLDHLDTLRSMGNLATTYRSLGRHGDALKLTEETLALEKAKLGPDHPGTLMSMFNLAVSYRSLGRHADALKLNEETLALRKAKLGPDHPDTLASMGDLASNYYYVGRYTDALNLNEEALTAKRAKLGPDHPDTLRSMGNLAASYHVLGRHVDALKLREETLALRKAKLGPDHPDTFRSMHHLAHSYEQLGRHADAVKLNEETLALRRAKLGPDHPDTLSSMTNLANSYEQLGRHGDALKLHEETLARTKATFGADHPETLTSMHNLTVSYRSLGRHADALKLNEETLALRQAKLGPDHPDTLSSMGNLANSYEQLGRHADALKLREESLALRKTKLGPDHPDTLRSMGNLANSYGQIGRHEDAFKLNEETLALRKAKLGPDHPETLTSMGNLAIGYDVLGRHADALKLREETLALRKARLGPDHPDTLESMHAVAESLVNLDRSAEAVPIIDDCIRLAEGKEVSRLITGVMNLRLRHYQKISDAAGCLETAGTWEALKRTDAQSLYQAACFRAVCAAVNRGTDTTPAGEAKAKEQADRAMAWLKQAVAAGYENADQIKADKNLDALRDREDFKKLLAGIPGA